MKLLVKVIALLLLLSTCKKQPEFPKHADFYFEMKVNGVPQQFYTCGGFSGGGQFECTKLRDNSLYIVAGCADKAIIFINGTNADGVYQLNNTNLAILHVNYRKSFTTNLMYTGALTIKRTVFKNINALQGNFSYQALDTSGSVTTITEGEFLMSF